MKIYAPGQRYGKLVLLEQTGKRHGINLWLAQCDCGKTALVRRDKLKAPGRSCGCAQRRNTTKIKPGQRYGLLTVLERRPRATAQGCIWWRCVCDCGNAHHAHSSGLTRNKLPSCGCTTGKRYQECAGCGVRKQRSKLNFYVQTHSPSGYERKCKDCRGSRRIVRRKITLSLRAQLAAVERANQEQRKETLRQIEMMDRRRQLAIQSLPGLHG